MKWNTRRTAGLLRAILAAVLILSGAGKLLDSEGAETFLRLVTGASPAAASVARRVIVCLSVSELALAAWLFSGRGARWSLAVTAGLLAGFSAVLASLLLRGIPVPECGCFGALLPGGSIDIGLIRNFGLLALTGAALLLSSEEEPA